MRIIAGRMKGRRLIVPKNGARPTTDRVRESLFAVLQDDFDGGHIVDLFAGSGSLGLEALSRGAQSAHFVERSRSAVEVLERNLESAQAEGLETKVFKEKVRYYLRNHWPEKGAELVLMDPPYGDGEGPKCLRLLAELHAAETGILAYEAAGAEQIDTPEGLTLQRTMTFGDTQMMIFQGGKNR